jgi:hypothetical protein
MLLSFAVRDDLAEERHPHRPTAGQTVQFIPGLPPSSRTCSSTPSPTRSRTRRCSSAVGYPAVGPLHPDYPFGRVRGLEPSVIRQVVFESPYAVTLGGFFDAVTDEPGMLDWKEVLVGQWTREPPWNRERLPGEQGNSGIRADLRAREGPSSPSSTAFDRISLYPGTGKSCSRIAVAETLHPLPATIPETPALSRGLGRGAPPNRDRRRRASGRWRAAGRVCLCWRVGRSRFAYDSPHRGYWKFEFHSLRHLVGVSGVRCPLWPLLAAGLRERNTSSRFPLFRDFHPLERCRKQTSALHQDLGLRLGAPQSPD